MFRAAIGSLLYFSLVHAALASPQSICGLTLDYVQPFQPRPDIAQTIFNRTPNAAQSQIRLIEVFRAARHGEIEEATIIKTQHLPGTGFDLDEAAMGSIRGVRALDGVSDSSHNITPIQLSGREARKVSFEANSRKGRFGFEGLLVFDRKTDTVWMIQLVFSKLKPLVPLYEPSLQDQRQAASRILRTVVLNP